MASVAAERINQMVDPERSIVQAMAPTILKLMGIEQPAAMTGESLV